MASKIKSIFSRLNRRDLPLFPKFISNKYFKIIFIFIAIISTVFVTKTILAAQISSGAKEFIETQNAGAPGNTNLENWSEGSDVAQLHVGIRGVGGTFNESNFDTGSSATVWVPQGLLGVTTKSLAALYDIPVSGVEYLAYVKDNFLGKSTYAASGYQGLSPLIPLWKGFRNVTYVLFSVIFVVIGIMIMLRIKISPQAVINIQSAIPGLITSLILVTFSYAIVGLLIDFSYVIEGLGVSIILKATNDSYSVFEILKNPNVMSRAFGIAPIITIIAPITGIIAGLFAVGPGGWIVGGLVFAIVVLVVLCVIFFNVFKFFIGLIKCYITILLKTIIGPLEIAMGAIPNMKMGFNTWFLDVFANIMVFPISLIYLVLVRKIMDAIQTADYFTNPMWTPPGLDKFSGGNYIAIIIGISGLFILAKLPSLITEFIFQIKPSPYGKALGESFASISGPAKKLSGNAFELATRKIHDDTNTNVDGTWSNFAHKATGALQYLKGHK